MDDEFKYRKFRAVFDPHRTDDLRPEVLEFVGKEFEFQYAWTMGKGDRWPGECAYTTNFSWWVPGRDLRRV